LSVISINVVVQTQTVRQRGDENTERGSMHDKKQRAENGALRNTAGEDE